MTRAESLATLAAWADLTRRSDDPLGYFSDPLPEAHAARSHGLAAVRAIRSLPACSCSPFTCYTFCTCLCHKSTHITEARLAVRCALAAVGLKNL